MSRYLRASVALASAFAGAVLCTAPAIAAPSGDPVAGDDRATAHADNVVAADCAELYPGSHDVTGDLTKTDDGTYLDITAVADGVEVVGVIVKGGPAYNRYDATDLGALPWLDLHSPNVSSGKAAAISHWFACGTGEPTTTTPSMPPSTPPSSSSSTPSSSVTTTTPTDSSAPASTTTTGPESSSAAVTTTTSADDIAPVAQDDDLASTGFDGGWLVMLAAGLLLAGGAVLLLMRSRARS
ncbi:LPXTG cell wall anchor domain-containing protein [Actinophytocola glycyrrhizae]|uniref:LPXTG cell wall anchor domain-containing protein n=1 Tax=Actinophytocola glycyrrhizae TaxID=2044873 RepID=A0ABV9S0D6_9PSEU